MLEELAQWNLHMYDPISKEYFQALFLIPIMDEKMIMDDFYSLDEMWMIMNIIQYGSNLKNDELYLWKAWNDDGWISSMNDDLR